MRSFVSIPAGVFEAPLGRYTLLTLSARRSGASRFAGAGYVAGENWEDFHHAFRYFDYLVAGAIVARRRVARAGASCARRRSPRSLARSDELEPNGSPVHSPP